MESFPQTKPREVVGPATVWYWCYGCERKAYIHKDQIGVALHLDRLAAREKILVPVGKKHYDGTWDMCDVR